MYEYEEAGDNGTALVKKGQSVRNKRGSNDDFRIERCFVETPFYLFL